MALTKLLTKPIVLIPLVLFVLVFIGIFALSGSVLASGLTAMAVVIALGWLLLKFLIIIFGILVMLGKGLRLGIPARYIVGVVIVFIGLFI